MTQSWHFFAVRAAAPSSFTWQWQKQGIKMPVTSAPFEYYFDCIADARKKGYAGPLPAGPKSPLLHLPMGPIEPKRVSTALPPKGHSGQGVMTVTPISAVDVKRRRTSGSRVS